MDTCRLSTATSGPLAATEIPLLAELVTPRSQRTYHAILLSTALVVLALSMILRVEGEHQVVVPRLGVVLPESCTWRRLTGMDCPGCGLTRSFINLARGNLARAWHFNPAGVLLFSMVLFQVPYRFVQLWRLVGGGDEIRAGRLSWFVWLFVVALLAQWVVRLLVSGATSL